jgi:hypothetical protein
MLTTTTRNASFEDMVALLNQQQEAKIDAVVPATRMRSRNGVFTVAGTEPQITPEGVTMVDGLYRPTGVFDEGLSAKLGVPLKYLRMLRAERPDLYDANLNGWLHGRTVHRASGPEVLAPADPRSFLFRGFRNAEGGEGVARALVSDSYGIVDNLDVLTAVLSGVRESAVEVTIGRCDLTDRRMYVQVSAPQVAVMAPELLKGYRSPFTGARGEDNPLVFAGFVIENSEVGDGATSLKPVITVQVCENGMTMTKDAMRAVHVGGKLPEGVVRWSEDTERKNLAVVTAKARDAVASFLSRDYVAKCVAELERQAGIEVADAARTVEVVAQRLKFTEEQRAGVLDHFIKGGQLTAGGVMQAVTSFCQTIEDADSAYALQDQGVAAMAVAATLR